MVTLTQPKQGLHIYDSFLIRNLIFKISVIFTWRL